MDKVYPRLRIEKLTCHCGASNCRRLDGLPWKVYHVQYESQVLPFQILESASFESALDFAVSKANSVKTWHVKQYAKAIIAD